MPHSQIRFTVEATAAAVHSARHRVSRAVRSWTASSDDELSFRLELVASELLTNGLEHAGGPMLVEVVLDAGLLVIAVHDGSSTKPQPCDADVDDERGRGLALIEALCLFQGSDRTTMRQALLGGFACGIVTQTGSQRVTARCSGRRNRGGPGALVGDSRRREAAVEHFPVDMMPQLSWRSPNPHIQLVRQKL